MIFQTDSDGVKALTYINNNFDSFSFRLKHLKPLEYFGKLTYFLLRRQVKFKDVHASWWRKNKQMEPYYKIKAGFNLFICVNKDLCKNNQAISGLLIVYRWLIPEFNWIDASSWQHLVMTVIIKTISYPIYNNKISRRI